MKETTQKDIAMSVSIKSIIINVVLTVFKLLAGIFANSAAMVSDAIHSASDVFSTFIVMIGISMAGKEADKGHPYGHERFECIAAIILAMILCLTGFSIGYSGIQKVMQGLEGSLAIPGIPALIAAVTSIVVKEWMYRFTKAAAKTANSGALVADAWHHRSDALSSIGSLVGIWGARLGFPILDPLACIVICLFIIKASYDIFMDAINKMMDCSCDDETAKQISGLVLSEEGVHSLDLMKTRLFGNKIYVDIEIGIDKELSLEKAHNIAHAVHDHIEREFENVKHCMVHVNPIER